MKEYKEGKYTITEFPGGDKYWVVDNQFHNENGPAVIGTNGHEQYYLNGEVLTKHEWTLEMRAIKFDELGL